MTVLTILMVAERIQSFALRKCMTSTKSLDMVCLQRFAALWYGIIKVSIIHLVEQAIISEQLSPIIMLHEFKGILIVVYNHHLQGERLETFQEASTRLVLETMPMVLAIAFLGDRCVA